MKMAHDCDMTFNQFVEEALRQTIKEVEAGRLTKEDAHKWLEEQEEIE
jgi:DNA-binding transcriptional regulator YhcF (GntR family)